MNSDSTVVQVVFFEQNQQFPSSGKCLSFSPVTLLRLVESGCISRIFEQVSMILVGKEIPLEHHFVLNSNVADDFKPVFWFDQTLRSSSVLRSSD